MEIKEVLALIEKEYHRSNELYNNKFVSNGEWVGVLREEYLEFERSIHKHKHQYHASDEIVEEAIQIGAMVLKGIVSLYKGDDTVDCGRNRLMNSEGDKSCAELHKMFSDKDAACPVCGEPLNPDF